MEHVAMPMCKRRQGRPSAARPVVRHLARRHRKGRRADEGAVRAEEGDGVRCALASFDFSSGFGLACMEILTFFTVDFSLFVDG